MKKAILMTTLASGLAFGAQQALAEDMYIGAQYELYTLSASGQDDLEPDGLLLKIGANLNENFILEGRFGRSLSDDNIPSAALKVDEHIGFYVKGGMEFADMVFPYVALGYTKVDFEQRGVSPDQTESDMSYGIGADVRLGKFQVGVEWMKLQDKTDYDLESMNLSAAYRF